MEYRRLGRSGVKIAPLCLGTDNFANPTPKAEAKAMLNRALDAGINLIDTSNSYAQGESERIIGRALKENGRRQQVLIATKVHYPTGPGPNERGNGRLHIIQACEDSLRRLQTDHIDLYQMHRWDATTPVEETMRALDDLVRSGKVRYIGASNYAAWQMARANTLAEFRGWSSFVTIQSHYHMLEREVEKEVIPFCQAHGVGFIPFFPLAGGFLTGKYKRGEGAPAGTRGERSPYVQGYMTDANYDHVEAMTAWAEERGHTMAELAHAWLLAQPTVCSVISGLTKLSHLEANAKAADWELTTDEVAEVEKLLGN